MSSHQTNPHNFQKTNKKSFLSFLQAGLDLKEVGGGAPWAYPSVYPHPYDAAFAGYPFNR